jgi:hypothetical protein
MQKRLTISIDEQVYERLYEVIGPRPYVLNQELESAYKLMAQDETRETEALEWVEASLGDLSNEP